MKKFCFLFIVLILIGEVFGAKTDFKVTFVSSDHIYIGGGKTDGLSIGAKLKLSKQKGQTALIQVVFISEHSASCTILDKAAVINEGDGVTIVSSGNAEIESDKRIDSASGTVSSQELDTNSYHVPAPVRISGNAAFVLYQWIDNSEANLDFTQSSARINFTAENIFKENLTLAVRTRGRYDIRTKAYDGGAAKTSWENRLWELSLSYYKPNSDLSYSIGRILPRRVGGIGYLDGAMADYRASSSISFGAFGGRQPEWLYDDLNNSITKAGFYGEYKTSRSANAQFNQAMGFVEEFHGGTINRAFVASTGSLRFGKRWGFNHNAELDINSGWRRERAGYTFGLSSLYLFSYFQVSSKVRTSINYDKRKNYWTFQYRSLPDSLFDDRINSGLRSSIDYSPVTNLWLSGTLGFRKYQQEPDATISYSANARFSGILNRGIALGTFYSGFNGPFEHGTNYRIGLDFEIRNFGQITTGFSNYIYSVEGQNKSRSSQSIELGLFKDFSRNYYLGSSFHSDSGDDIHGLRLQFELGYRY